MTRQPSLRSRIIIWLTLPNIVFCAVAWIGSYYIGCALSQSAYDEGLADTLRTVATSLKQRNGALILDLSEDAIQTLASDPSDNWYFSVKDLNGKVLAGNHELAFRELVGSNLYYFDTRSDKESLREAAQKMLVLDENGQKRPVLVQVAESKHGREAAVRSVEYYSVLLLLPLIALSTVAAWLALRMLLAPIERLRKALSERTPGNMAGLATVGIYREIIPLVDEINLLLVRLRRELDSQKLFLGDVAHTLRTRMAGVKLHAELGARAAKDKNALHSMQRVTQGISSLSKIVVQLLMLARNEHQAREVEVLVPLNLDSVGREVVRDFQSRAQERGIKLSYQSTAMHPEVIGNAARIKIMLENLLDNSLQYTEQGGSVQVLLDQNEGVELAVIDSGRGISELERDRIFSPFYRIPGSPGEGSGLGLSIVKGVVDQHSATISIDQPASGTGTVVRIIFPQVIQKAQEAYS